MTNKLTWYGHATLGLETGAHKLIIDPFFTGNPAAPIAPEAVEADFILVSHGHGDHVGDTVSIAKRTGATVISNFEIASWFEGQGVEKTHGQHLGGGYTHPFGYLKLTLALHGSALPDGSNGGNPAGFLLTTLDEKKIYLAGMVWFAICLGLLVLTQDGRVAKQLIGQDSEIEKEYLVRVDGSLSTDGMRRLQHGLTLDGVQLRPAGVTWQNEHQLRFVLREGRKRQIRRMCEMVGLMVTGLKRVRSGNVMLGGLPMGKWRYLRPDERF